MIASGELLQAVVGHAQLAPAYEKMALDFRLSVLGGPLLFHEARETAANDLFSITGNDGKARLLPHFDPRTFSPRVWNGKIDDDALAVVKRHMQDLGRPIRANCLGILVASYLVLSEMERFGFLKVDRPEQISSREQVLYFDSLPEPNIDVVIAADPPLFYSNKTISGSYIKAMEIHKAKQFVLRKKGRSRAARNGHRPCLWIYEKSSVQHQLQLAKLERKRPDGRFPALAAVRSEDIHEITSMADFPAVIARLRPGDMLIVWEPFASRMCAVQTNNLEFVRGHEFQYTYSLFFSPEWLGFVEQMKSFASVFVADWQRLRVNHRKEWGNICHDTAFLNNYAFCESVVISTTGSGEPDASKTAPEWVTNATVSIPPPSDKGVIANDDVVVVHAIRREISWRGKVLRLANTAGISLREWLFLLTLAKAPIKTVFRKSDISTRIVQLEGKNKPNASDNTIEKHCSSLRQKLKAAFGAVDWIETVPEGYRLRIQFKVVED